MRKKKKIKLSKVQAEYLDRMKKYLKANVHDEENPSIDTDPYENNVACEHYIFSIWFTGFHVWTISEAMHTAGKQRSTIVPSDIPKLYKSALKGDESFRIWIEENYPEQSE